MNDFAENEREARRIIAGILLADIDLAFTFLDVATASHNEETVKRNINNAREIYNSTTGTLATKSFEIDARAKMQVGLELLGQKLEQVQGTVRSSDL